MAVFELLFLHTQSSFWYHKRIDICLISAYLCILRRLFSCRSILFFFGAFCGSLLVLFLCFTWLVLLLFLFMGLRVNCFWSLFILRNVLVTRYNVVSLIRLIFGLASLKISILLIALSFYVIVIQLLIIKRPENMLVLLLLNRHLLFSIGLSVHYNTLRVIARLRSNVWHCWIISFEIILTVLLVLHKYEEEWSYTKVKISQSMRLSVRILSRYAELNALNVTNIMSVYFQ